MKKTKLLVCSALVALLGVTVFSSSVTNKNVIGTHAAVNSSFVEGEDRKLDSLTGRENLIDETLFDYQAIEGAHTWQNKDVLRVNMSNIAATQRIYGVAPKLNRVGRLGVLAIELKSSNGVTLSDLNIKYNRGTSPTSYTNVTLNFADAVDGNGNPLPEITNQWQTIYIDAVDSLDESYSDIASFIGDGGGGYSDFSILPTQGTTGNLDINYIWYEIEQGLGYYSTGDVYQIDNFDGRTSVSDATGSNVYWRDSWAGGTIAPNRVILYNTSYSVASLTNGNADNKYGNLAINAFIGSISEVTPIYTTNNVDFFEGTAVAWANLRDHNNVELGSISTSGFATKVINFANSGIEYSNMVGIKITGSSGVAINEIYFTGENTAAKGINDLVDYLLLEDTDGQCNTKFNTAKTMYLGLSETDKTTFTTGTDRIAEARVRYEAWATHLGQSAYDASEVLLGAQGEMNTNNIIAAISIISLVGTSSIILFVFLNKRKTVKR